MKQKINLKALSLVFVGILIIVGVGYGGYWLLNKEKPKENNIQVTEDSKIAFRRNGNVYFLENNKESQITADGKCLVSFTPDNTNNTTYANYEYPCYKILGSSKQNLILLKYSIYPTNEEQILIYNYDTQSFHNLNSIPFLGTSIAWNNEKEKFIFKSENNIIKVDASDFYEEKIMTYEPIIGCGGASSELITVYDEEAGTFGMNGGETLIWNEGNNQIITNTSCNSAVLKTFNYQQDAIINWPANLQKAVSSDDDTQIAIFEDKKLEIYNSQAQIINSYESPVIGKFPVWSNNKETIFFLSDSEIWQFDIPLQQFSKLYSSQNSLPVKLSVGTNNLYFSLLYQAEDLNQVETSLLKNIYKLDLKTSQVEKIITNADMPTIVK